MSVFLLNTYDTEIITVWRIPFELSMFSTQVRLQESLAQKSIISEKNQLLCSKHGLRLIPRALNAF